MPHDKKQLNKLHSHQVDPAGCHGADRRRRAEVRLVEQLLGLLDQGAEGGGGRCEGLRVEGRWIGFGFGIVGVGFGVGIVGALGVWSTSAIAAACTDVVRGHDRPSICCTNWYPRKTYRLRNMECMSADTKYACRSSWSAMCSAIFVPRSPAEPADAPDIQSVKHPFAGLLARSTARPHITQLLELVLYPDGRYCPI